MRDVTVDGTVEQTCNTTLSGSGSDTCTHRQTDRLDDGTNIDRCPVFSAAIYKYITCK